MGEAAPRPVRFVTVSMRSSGSPDEHLVFDSDEVACRFGRGHGGGGVCRALLLRLTRRSAPVLHSFPDFFRCFCCETFLFELLFAECDLQFETLALEYLEFLLGLFGCPAQA